MEGCVKMLKRRMGVEGKDGGRTGSDARRERGGGESEQG